MVPEPLTARGIELKPDCSQVQSSGSSEPAESLSARNYVHWEQGGDWFEANLQGFSVVPKTAEQTRLAPLWSDIPVNYLHPCTFSVPETLCSRFSLVQGASRGESPCPLFTGVVTEQEGPFLRTLAFCKQQCQLLCQGCPQM